MGKRSSRKVTDQYASKMRNLINLDPIEMGITTEDHNMSEMAYVFDTYSSNTRFLQEKFKLDFMKKHKKVFQKTVSISFEDGNYMIPRILKVLETSLKEDVYFICPCRKYWWYRYFHVGSK